MTKPYDDPNDHLYYAPPWLNERNAQSYPLTAAKRKRSLGSATEKQLLSKSVKEGGSQIEYEDQDPRIHALWLEEMHRHGITPTFTLPVR